MGRVVSVMSAAAENDLLTDFDDFADLMGDLTEDALHCVAVIVRETARMEKTSGAAATLAMLDDVEASLTRAPGKLH